MLLVKLLNSQTWREHTRVPHLKPIIIDADLHSSNRSVVTVTDGVHNGLPYCLFRIFRHYLALSTSSDKDALADIPHDECNSSVRLGQQTSFQCLLIQEPDRCSSREARALDLCLWDKPLRVLSEEQSCPIGYPFRGHQAKILHYSLCWGTYILSSGFKEELNSIAIYIFNA